MCKYRHICHDEGFCVSVLAYCVCVYICMHVHPRMCVCRDSVSDSMPVRYWKAGSLAAGTAQARRLAWCWRRTISSAASQTASSSRNLSAFDKPCSLHMIHQSRYISCSNPTSKHTRPSFKVVNSNNVSRCTPITPSYQLHKASG